MLLFFIGLFVGVILSLGILGFMAAVAEEREREDAKITKEFKKSQQKQRR